MSKVLCVPEKTEKKEKREKREKKIVVVNAGIGLATVCKFLEEGAFVVSVDKTHACDCSDYDGYCCVRFDFDDLNEIGQLALYIFELCGKKKIDVLVANHATFTFGKVATAAVASRRRRRVQSRVEGEEAEQERGRALKAKLKEKRAISRGAMDTQEIEEKVARARALNLMQQQFEAETNGQRADEELEQIDWPLVCLIPHGWVK